MPRSPPVLQKLRLIIEDCDEQEATALIPILKSVISVIRNKNDITKNNKPASHNERRSRLCVIRLALY